MIIWNKINKDFIWGNL